MRLALFAGLLALVAADPKPADPKLPPLDDPAWKAVGTAGLKSWDVKEGTGDPVKAGDSVRCHYTGWLTDGKVFDASRRRNATATFPLNKVIPGWQEGIPGMKPGGTRRLSIPAALAYKDRTDKPGIPPGSTLVFEVEYLGDPLKMPPLDAKEWQPGPEGLKVWDVTVGGGAEVKPGDTVTCHYAGWTTDGKGFDNSIERGQPSEFGLDGVVRGWTVGIPGMKLGGVRRLVIPYHLAYGENGSPPKIPPRADLVFEIEVQKAKSN